MLSVGFVGERERETDIYIYICIYIYTYIDILKEINKGFGFTLSQKSWTLARTVVLEYPFGFPCSFGEGSC